jgi:sulfur-oxidizing protein SoxZ
LLDLNNRRIARNVINDMRCTYMGQEVFRIEPSSGLSANPYVEFFLRATQSGEIAIDWVDDRGDRGQVKRMLIVV